ncbi:hypothetical protein FRC20_010411 [Serendipita sp. 405]|nr:hypothetical protein FRC15_000301 [Serendipita sp. 397]KAG8863953.1 hypothetical protein FRC20_010411 [Serendipita sp. 405]
MQRPQRPPRSSSEYPSSASPTAWARRTTLTYLQSSSNDHINPTSRTSSSSGASVGVVGRKGHSYHGSLPHNLLSTKESNYTSMVGIPLAEVISPPPSVTGKILHSVKRAVSLRKDKTPHEDEQVLSFPPRSATPQNISPSAYGSSNSVAANNNLKRTRTGPSQTIITAHRSPFGGYTKSGDLVMTRTTDGRRLPVPQPHPHSKGNSRVSIPPPPAQSALRKTSSASLESGDSYTLVCTPDSASSVGSVNGRGAKTKALSLAKLIGKGQRTHSNSSTSQDDDLSKTAAKKAVRFTEDSPDS